MVRLPMKVINEQGEAVYECPNCGHQTKSVQGMIQGHMKYFCKKTPR